RIGATLRVLLDAFAQAAQPDSKFCPLHAGHDEFRGAARIEDERAFERNAMTALRARLAPHDAELKRMDVFDGGGTGKHHDRIRNLAHRKTAYKCATQDRLDVVRGVVAHPRIL